MIEYKQGDITTATGIICHGVNNQNVMGAGVAKAIATKWPMVKEAYHRAYKYPTLPFLGKVQHVSVSPNTTVINMWTQTYYGREKGRVYADLWAIDQCLREVVNKKRSEGKTHVTVNLPKVGCGLGGLTWEIVKPVLVKISNDYYDRGIKVKWVVWELCSQ